MTPEEQALAQIRSRMGESAGPIQEAAKELADTHAEVFVQRMVSYKDKPDEVITFTMGYFQALKEAIDTAIMQSSELEK